MLIDSPRLTPADRAEWARRTRYDRAQGASPRMRHLEGEATAAVRRFAAAHDDWRVSVSWGKDSVAAAHVALLAVPDARIVWAKARDVEMPECCLVRDAFLATHPAARYEEVEYAFRVPLRFELTGEAAEDQDALREALSGPYVSGVRAEESDVRRISMFRHGTETANTCRPIGLWRATDVFAYLEGESLPVHPAYAMTFGGLLDRRMLRVHALGTVLPGTPVGNATTHTIWEDSYYADVIESARAARACLWA